MTDEAEASGDCRALLHLEFSAQVSVCRACRSGCWIYGYGGLSVELTKVTSRAMHEIDRWFHDSVQIPGPLSTLLGLLMRTAVLHTKKERKQSCFGRSHDNKM